MMCRCRGAAGEARGDYFYRFSEIPVGKVSARALGEALNKNQTLARLNLATNQIGDARRALELGVAESQTGEARVLAVTVSRRARMYNVAQKRSHH